MKFKQGDKVHYCTNHGTTENGIYKCLKVVNKKTCAYVVYKCNNDWENYANYTAELTDIRDLKPGWILKLKYKPIIKNHKY